MAFSLYGLLGPDAPTISNESLFVDLKKRFSDVPTFSIKFERLPFAKNDTLALRWDSWLVRIAYEEGNRVLEDSIEIQKRKPKSAPLDVSNICRRIRVAFSSDDEKIYTNEIIYIMDFIGEINNIFIYDPQQNDFIL